MRRKAMVSDLQRSKPTYPPTVATSLAPRTRRHGWRRAAVHLLKIEKLSDSQATPLGMAESAEVGLPLQRVTNHDLQRPGCPARSAVLRRCNNAVHRNCLHLSRHKLCRPFASACRWPADGGRCLCALLPAMATTTRRRAAPKPVPQPRDESPVERMQLALRA